MPKLTMPDGTVLDLPYDHPKGTATPNSKDMELAQGLVGGSRASASARATSKNTKANQNQVTTPVVRPPGYTDQRTVPQPTLPGGQIGQMRSMIGSPDQLNMFSRFTETPEGQNAIRGIIDQMIMQRRTGATMGAPPRSIDIVGQIMNVLRGGTGEDNFLAGRGASQYTPPRLAAESTSYGGRGVSNYTPPRMGAEPIGFRPTIGERGYTPPRRVS